MSTSPFAAARSLAHACGSHRIDKTISDAGTRDTRPFLIQHTAEQEAALDALAVDELRREVAELRDTVRDLTRQIKNLSYMVA